MKEYPGPRCWLNVSHTINEYLPYIKYYLTAIYMSGTTSGYRKNLISIG